LKFVDILDYNDIDELFQFLNNITINDLKNYIAPYTKDIYRYNLCKLLSNNFLNKNKNKNKNKFDNCLKECYFYKNKNNFKYKNIINNNNNNKNKNRKMKK